MIYYYINGSDRSTDVTEASLQITSQIQRRSDTCSFEVYRNTPPAVNNEIKIYDGDEAASQSSTTLVLKGYFERNTGKFYAGQVLWVRIGQANAEKVTVQSYNETTLTITLVTAPTVAVVIGDKVGELVFGGIVAKVTDKNLHSLSNLLWDVQGVDFTKLFDKKNISDSWANADARYIINDFADTTVNYNKELDDMDYADNTAVQAEWIEDGGGSNPTVDTTNKIQGTSAVTFSW